MDIWRSLGGEIALEITSADVSAILSALNKAGILLQNVSIQDELTVSLQISRQQYNKVCKIVAKRGASLKIKGRRGLYWTGKSLLRRPVFLVGLLFMLVLGCILPSKILFFRVEGNINVPPRLILETASQCGISFFTSRREVRSEKMKNALLEALPQLQWAGINTQGCVATISVREREQSETTEQPYGVSSIIACRDGVVSSCTAIRGNLLCMSGQAVKSGEVLISGYTDCGLSIQATRADGEIFARTQRQIAFFCLQNQQSKGETTGQIKKYSLIIGKKRINLYKGSGILPTECDKIYSEQYVTLPGGFQLPVCLVTEVWNYRTATETAVSDDDALNQLTEFAGQYLQQEMIAGQILTKEESMESQNGAFCLHGKYACHEMIGRIQKEEIISPYGK